MVKPTLLERMTLAVVLSLTLHFAIVIAIQGQPRESGATSAVPLTARLEPVANAAAQAPSAESVEAPAEPPPAEQPAAERRAADQPSPPEKATSAHAPLKPQASDQRAAIDVPVIRDPTYYAARFLDEYPQPLSPIELRYPAQAAFTDVSGSVTLLLLIDDDGTLNEASVVEARPAAIFDEAALAAFRGMRFSPGRKDGRAVRSRVLITVGFESNKPSSSAVR